MKKILVSIMMSLSLLMQSASPARAQIGPAILYLCIAAGAVGAIVYITNCSHDSARWWIVRQKGNPRAIPYPRIAKNKEEIDLSDTELYVSGPWKDYDSAMAHLRPNSNAVSSDLVHVECSTDKIHWTEEAAFECDAEAFIYAVQIPKVGMKFYRIRTRAI